MKDRLGSIINIMDESETLKTTYSYNAFGRPTATYNSGQVDCMFRFTGCPRHSTQCLGTHSFFYQWVEPDRSHVPSSPSQPKRSLGPELWCGHATLGPG